MSLMQNTQPTQTEPINTETPSANSDWYIMDGVKGEGERPAYLKEKFNWNVAKQAQEYVELEKYVGERGSAPDSYDFGEYAEHFNLEDQTLQEYIAFAKEKRLPQDVFSKNIETFVKLGQAHIPDWDTEIAKLGLDGAQKVETVRLWGKNTFSEKAFTTMCDIADSAEVVEFLDEIRQYQYQTSTPVPTGSRNDPTFVPLTKDQVIDEMSTPENYKRYKDDANFRAEISRKLEQAVR